MIYHELGYAYLVEADRTKTPVEVRTPRDVAMAGDEPGASGDAMACAIEAVRDWLAWIFEAGPRPVIVARRLVECTSAHAPWLLIGLKPQEARAVSVLGTEAQALRVICRATAAEVHAAMAETYRRECRTWEAVPVISTIAMRLVVEASMDAEDALVRAKAMETWLRRVWDYSPRPGWLPRLRDAMKTLFVDARALMPETILNMSGEEIAALFGQGRAAESARVKQQVTVRLQRAGFRHATLRFQKSATACRKYAEKARGNRNRAKGAARSTGSGQAKTAAA